MLKSLYKFKKSYLSNLFWNLVVARVLNGELYAQRLHKLIYLNLFTDCFTNISLHSSEPFDEWKDVFRDTFMKQSVNKFR